MDPGIVEVERVQNGLRLRFRESHFLRLFALVYLFLLSSVLDFIKLSKGAIQILAIKFPEHVFTFVEKYSSA